ncbi:MAG: sulfatase-like hydrolase/transferase, partial [Planctomycetia bacterium]
MLKSSFLLKLGLILATFCYITSLHAAEVQKKKPNILFLFADDQRADAIRAHGNPHIQTPNLDRLADEGYSFRSNYIFGGNSGAVCLPSRAMLMTGRSWFHIKDTRTLKGLKTLPELLKENGYTTFGTGKWHNGEASWLRSFDRGKNVFFGGMSDHTKVPVRDLGSDGKLTKKRTGKKFSTELFADAAVEFLQNHDKTKPFFAYVAFTAPHDPRQPPLSYREPYYRNLPPLPKNFQKQFPFDIGMMTIRDEALAGWPRTEAVVRDQLAEYYGLITQMDEQIGRILKTLEATGEADNTIVIFSADNGLAIGSHGLLGKQNVFECSMRVPLIITGPGIPAGKSTDAFTYLLDIFPTLCDLSAATPPKDLEGKSLQPLWEGEKDQLRDSVFLPFVNHQRAVRDEQWKLIVYPKIQYMQLFDLKNDPLETTNLIDRAEYAPVVERLKKKMTAWQTQVGDKVKLPTKL